MYQFKTLTAQTKFLSYKDWPLGQYVIGTVERFQDNKKNAKNKDVIVTILDTNVKTDKVLLEKNDLFTINGTTALQKVVDMIEEGDIIKVTYLGTETVKQGQWKGTQANKLDVQVAPAQDKAKFVSSQSEESDELI